MGCIWQEQHSWDYASWRGIKAFTVNTMEQPGMLWLENSRCSLNLPLRRAPLLFQLGFGGSLTSPLLRDDSLQMPSLSLSSISFGSCQCHPFIRWRGHNCATSGPLRVRAARELTSTVGPNLKTHGTHLRLCRWQRIFNRLSR